MLVSKIAASQIIQTQFNNRKSAENMHVSANYIQLPRGIDAKNYVNINFKGVIQLLEAASESGGWNKISAELARGTNINSKNIKGDTAIIVASLYGCYDIVEKLCELKELDVNIQNLNGETALLAAVRNGNKKTVGILLRHPKIDVNIQENKYKFSPIMAAVFCNNDYMINRLLHVKDIDLTLVDIEGHTAYDIAINSVILQTETLNKLKSMTEEQLNNGKLRYEKEKCDITKLAPEENIWSEDEISDKFMELVTGENYKTAEEMLRATPLIDLKRNEGLILNEVCGTREPDFVRKVFDYERIQPEMRKNYEARRKAFLENIPTLRYDKLKTNNVVLSNIETFKVLMTKPEFNPNDVVDKISLFEKACILDSEGNLAKDILSKYGNVKTSNASKTRNSVIKDLIKNYEEIGKYKIIMNQIEDKAFVQSERELAAEELQKFMESEDFKPEIVDSVGNTVLHIAATLPVDSGQKLIRMAIDKGIDKDAGNVAGQTALMSAVKALVKSDEKDKAGRTNLLANIKFLLDMGVNIDAQDNSGKTAFHFACMGTVAALLELLITKNPNVLLLDKTNMRACAMLKTPEMKRIYNNYLGAV